MIAGVKKPLRHCMVVYAGYPFYETRVQREAEALVAHGIEVDVICPLLKEEPLEEDHCGVHIHRVKQRWMRRNGLLSQFFLYIKFFVLASLKLAHLNFKHHYDVVQAHNLPDFLVFTALLPKLTGSRVILDLHDLMPEFFQNRVGQGKKNFVRQLVVLQEGLSCRFADHVITVSEHWRQTLIQRGVPPEKCSVVMNLADTRIFTRIDPPSQPATTDDQFCLFYHGEMPERYGLDLVLRAMYQLLPCIPGIRFKMVGNGPFVKTLREIASELGLFPDHVEIIPGMPVEDLPPVIATADVAVVPYRNDIFTDSLLPTKLMEYAAMGVPSIVARTTAISLYFDDSMVQYFEPDDVDGLARCIQLLFEDKKRREKMSDGILQFNQRHNWPETAARYVANIERLAARG
jgi:glycosyltransferase involved in cell wall biosynthesis